MIQKLSSSERCHDFEYPLQYSQRFHLRKMLIPVCMQEYDCVEQSIHEFEMQGMYRDGAEIKASNFFSKDWWLSRRFFWERILAEVPHCVVFVFDGSSDPFLDQESLEFFKEVFKDCTNHG